MEFERTLTDVGPQSTSFCAVDPDRKQGYSLSKFAFLNSKYELIVESSQTMSKSFQKNILAAEGFRLSTLCPLPESCTVSRIRLAHAGFYYDANKASRDESNINEVVCYSCGLHYGKWDAKTDPLTIHRELHPGCLHLKSLIPNAPDRASRGKENLEYDRKIESSTLSSLSPYTQIESSNSSTSSVCDATYPGPTTAGDGEPPSSTANGFVKDGSKITSNDLLQSNDHVTQLNGEPLCARADASMARPLDQPGRSGGDIGRSARDGDTFATDSEQQRRWTSSYSRTFNSIESRIATFYKWPSYYEFPVNFQHIAECGFFYTGCLDCIRCFYCGVRLFSWENRYDVIEEHLKWRPMCVFQQTLTRTRNGNISNHHTTSSFRQRSSQTHHSTGLSGAPDMGHPRRCADVSNGAVPPVMSSLMGTGKKRNAAETTFIKAREMGFPVGHILTALMELQISDKHEVQFETFVDRILEISSRSDAINSTNPSFLSASDTDIDGPGEDSLLGEDRIISTHQILTRSVSYEADDM